MPELIVPNAHLHEAWLDAFREWEPGAHLDGSGLRPSDDVESAGGFAAYVSRLVRFEDPETEQAQNFVPCTFRWMVDGDRVLGTVALRHELNDALRESGGHIGYSVRPSERRKGVATWALHETLGTARSIGLDRVLITCDDGNVASQRTIEKAGGVLEEARDGRRYYWFDLRPEPAPSEE